MPTMTNLRLAVGVLLLMCGLSATAEGQASSAADIAALKKAAERGNTLAQLNLGTMYTYGQGVPQDYTQAVAWFRKSAEQGNVRAQFNLGVMYAKGRGVPQDYTQAVSWLRKAAEQGDASAQNNLGFMYANGQGVPQDYVSAHLYFNLAASRATGERQERSAESRDGIAKKMTAQQIADAQKRAREWTTAFEQRQKKQ